MQDIEYNVLIWLVTQCNDVALFNAVDQYQRSQYSNVVEAQPDHVDPGV